MELQLDSFLHRLPIFIQQDEALRKIFFRGQDIALHMSTCLLFADTDSADLPLELPQIYFAARLFASMMQRLSCCLCFLPFLQHPMIWI
ncbi:MAG: hypothetical protein IKM30_02590 [Oscillospiraceae bacterium]|nr:hypothetical protein [Oscillospiraceae bacterium]